MRIRLVLWLSLIVIVLVGAALPAAAQDPAPGPITIGPWELTLVYTHTTDQFKSGYYPNETTYTANPGFVFLEMLFEVRLTDTSQATTLKDSEFEMVVLDADGTESPLQGTGSGFNNYCLMPGCQSEYYFDSISTSNIIYIFTISSELGDPNYTLTLGSDTSVPFTVPYVALFDTAAAAESVTPIDRAGLTPITLDNAASLTAQSSLTAYGSYLEAFTFSADGMRIVSTGCDLYGQSACLGYAVRTWDLDSNQLTTAVSVGDGTYGASGKFGTKISPDGALAGALNWESQVFLWDVATGDPLPVTVSPESANELIFSPDGTQLAVCAGDNPITLWDTGTGEAGMSVAGPCSTGTFSADGQWLVVWGGNPQYGSGDGLLHLWDMTSGQAGPVIGDPASLVMQSRFVFNPDHTLLASGSPSSYDGDGMIHLWNTADGTEKAVWSQSATSKAVLGLAFSPDGSLLASGDESGTVHLWDVSTQQEVAALTVTDGGSASDLVFSPDGTLLAVGRGGTIELWGIAP